MKKIIYIASIVFIFAGCVNKHGISLRYYSDCEEYYDLQGYYHKDCGKDDIVTYKEMKEKANKIINKKQKNTESNNVW
jgi:hypothetical protein